MTESLSHKKGKGSAEKTEIPISENRRLDAIRGSFAIEVERGDTPKKINQAISR